MKNYQKKLLYLLGNIAFIMAVPTIVFTQVIIIPLTEDAEDTVFTLPPFTLGDASYNVTLHPQSPNGDVTWEIIEGSSILGDGGIGLQMNLGGSAFSSGSRTVTPNGTVEDITFTPSGVAVTDPDYNILLEVTDSDGPTVEVRCTIPVQARPVSVVLVLDKSGSMRTKIAEANSPTRWQAMLKRGLGPMIASFKAQSNDMKLGLVLFSTDQTLAAWNLTSINDPDITFFEDTDRNGELDAVEELATTFDPRGGTPLGCGIQTALGMFDYTQNRDRKIVVMTDGRQNQNDMVEAPYVLDSDANDATIVYDEIVHDNSRADPISDCVFSNPSDFRTPLDLGALDVEIFTIGVNLDSYEQALLAGITDATTGSSANMALDIVSKPEDFAEMFTGLINSILRNASPQDVLKTRGTSKALIEQEFTVNRGNDLMVIEVFAHNFKALGVPINPDDLYRGSIDKSKIPAYLEKNGVRYPLGPYITDIIGNSFAVASIVFPAFKDDEGQPIPFEGEWKLILENPLAERQVTFDYNLRVKVDEKRLKYEVKFGDQATQIVGENVPIEINIAVNGAPIEEDPSTIELRILKPGADIGKLLATTNVGNTAKPSEPNATTGEAKRAAALQDSDLVAALEPKAVKVQLNKQSDGVFAGEYPTPQETGSYQALLQFRGTHPLLGTYSRTTIATFVVVADAAIAEKSDHFFTPNSNNNTSGTIWIQPVNSAGNPIGIDNTHRIRLVASEGTVGPVFDNLDGYYMFPITFPAGTDPDVQLFMIDQNTPLIQQPLSQFKVNNKPPLPPEERIDKPGVLPFGLGITVPTRLLNSDFANTYKNGWLVELKLLLRSNQTFAWNIEGGFYTFGSSLLDNLNIWGVATGPRFNLNVAGYKPYFDLNAGYYKANNQGGTFGLNAGLGLPILSFGPVDLEAGASYIYLPNSAEKIEFLGLGVTIAIKL